MKFSGNVGNGISIEELIKFWGDPVAVWIKEFLKDSSKYANMLEGLHSRNTFLVL